MTDYRPEEYCLTTTSSFACSLIVHIIFFLCFTFNLPLIKNDNSQEQAIVIDLVTISEITNINTVAKAQEQFVHDKKTVKPVTIKDLPQSKSIGSSPIIPTTQITKTQEKSQTAKAQKKKISVSKLKISEKQASVPKKQESQLEKKIELKQFNIEKNKKIPHKLQLKPLKVKDKKPLSEDKKILNKKFEELESLIEAESVDQFNHELQLSMTEIDSIRSQIIRSWNQIAFLGRDDNMSVTLLLNMDKSGNVINIQTVLENNSNPLYGAFVDSAIRAVKMASPIKNLPLNKFQSWKEIEMPFSTRDLK